MRIRQARVRDDVERDHGVEAVVREGKLLEARLHELDLRSVGAGYGQHVGFDVDTRPGEPGWQLPEQPSGSATRVQHATSVRVTADQRLDHELAERDEPPVVGLDAEDAPGLELGCAAVATAAPAGLDTQTSASTCDVEMR